MPMMTRSKTKEIIEKNIGRKGKLWETFTVDVIPELLTDPCDDEDRDEAIFNPTDFNQSEKNLMELMRVCPDLGIERALEFLAASPLAEAIRRGKEFVAVKDTMIIIDDRIKNKKLREEEERFVGIPKLESCPPPPPKVTKKKEEPKKAEKKTVAPRKTTGRQKAGIPKVATGVTKKGAQKKKAEPRKTQKKEPRQPQIKKIGTGLIKKGGEQKKVGIRLGDLARLLMASAAHWTRQRKVAFKCPKRFLQDENAPPTRTAAEPMEY
ncbi:hypothetical protein GCK72_004294 [Caenorhabditis remanei]|uniref:Uncharacterized protein n=1 Tax=Caenorhabditis remanei TaxID=31234 RepID=A0A6A5HB23_CAERE|nr:hypothetical protein GCK72_004294 [Caenorhabditis remanei]KAF1764347.1 hypothetical protein GCK72_004294 [Caenorhabditis remanei]